MLKITSPDFEPGGVFPKKFTCQGDNINPTLRIELAPPETKSLVLIMDDPDAPVGTFTHWLMWNIDPSTKEITENSVPAGAVVGTNSAGKNSYIGPCPPSGIHRFFIKVYALNKSLDLPKTADAEALLNAVNQDRIAEGEIMARYYQQ